MRPINNNRGAIKAHKQRSEYSLAWQRSAGNNGANINRATLGGFAKGMDEEIAALLQEGVLEDNPSETSKGDKEPQPKTEGAKNPAGQWTKNPRRKS